MKKILTSILPCLMFSGLLPAQTPRLSERNTIAWCNFFTTVSLAKKWSVHGEIQLRRVDGFKNTQQNLYRVGINYQPIPEFLVRVGGAYVQTFPYGEYTLNVFGKKTEEYRFFEMIQLSHKIYSLDFSHRFMIEQRWNAKYKLSSSEKPDDWPFSNRLRYMIRCQKNIGSKKQYYLAGYDELFTGFGKNVGENVFDQNRFVLMIGKKISTKFRVEVGFLAQTQQLAREINGSNVFQYNRGFICNSYFNFDRKN